MARRIEERHKALKRGVWSERLAALSLILKGYRIMAMRYRTPMGEIDLIARKGDLIAFVEVKARASRESAIHAVNGQSQRRIRAAADSWLAGQPDHGRLSWRFDIVTVRPLSWPEHFEGAF